MSKKTKRDAKHVSITAQLREGKTIEEILANKHPGYVTHNVADSNEEIMEKIRTNLNVARHQR